MAEVTTFTCDRCKKSSTGGNEIGIEWMHVTWGRHGTQAEAQAKAQWCRECRLHLGVERSVVKPPTPVRNPPPTLEEVIREII